MRLSCVMTASNITPPVEEEEEEEEGAQVDGKEWVGGVIVSVHGRFG